MPERGWDRLVGVRARGCEALGKRDSSTQGKELRVKTRHLQYLGWSGLAASPWAGTLPSTTQRNPHSSYLGPCLTDSSLSPAVRWQWSHSQQLPPLSRLAGFSSPQVSLWPLQVSHCQPRGFVLPFGHLPGAGASRSQPLRGYRGPAALSMDQPAAFQGSCFGLGPEGRQIFRRRGLM